MTHQELVSRLQAFRLAVEQEARTTVLDMRVPVGLILFDLTTWLGLSEEEQIAVLGVANALRLHRDYGIEFEV